MSYRPRVTAGLLALSVAAVTASVWVSAANDQGSREDASGKEKPDAAPQYGSIVIRDVPHVRQKPDFCGEACVAMYLNKMGQPVDQDYVFDMSGLDPTEARGCYTSELLAALEKIGFRGGPAWHHVRAGDDSEQMETLFSALYADLTAGVPSIVCMHYDDRPGAGEHFRLVLGYDAESSEVIYHEPAAADGAYRRMARGTFMKLWPLKYEKHKWTVIRLRLEPGVLAGGQPAGTHTAADFAQHLMKRKKKVPASGFTIVIQPPFVVVGDESPGTVRDRAERTVKWAVDKLKDAYFKKDPVEILDIWLFKDHQSYRNHCAGIFGRTPTTRFGYFSRTDKALVMNIATGGGTLVHEIVHAFMAANFAECPAWFNEGLASLYEQSAQRDGRIVGLTNWRLVGGWPPDTDGGLQRAVREDRLPTFETLCTMSDDEFYRDTRGTNYAHARYLCYYLQEQGLLRKFYHAFHASRHTDPTGYKSLVAVLGPSSMDQFEEAWRRYVLKLRFP